jgi:hypothetical protein
MFKKIFKEAKKLLKNPVVQLGIGALLPQASFISKLPAFLQNPAVLQGGISLLAGDKPENVVKNLALGALTSGGMNVLQGKDFSGGVGDFFGMGDTKFFKKPEEMSYEDFLKMKAGEEGITQLGDSEKAIFAQMFKEQQNQSSPFMSLLTNPYTISAGAQLGLAKLAADQLKDQQRQAEYFFNPDESQFDLNKGGGIQKFAMGSPEFPRMTGDISGPGTGTSDSIPAMLSDGEHVLTKQEVTQIGGGDNDLGHQRLYAARENIRKQANSNGIGRS